MSAEEGEMSKKARQRANKKARDAEEKAAAEAAAAAPAPEPKAKGKAKAKEAAPAAKAAAEPAAKAKGKAKAEPKAEPKAAAKGAAKAKAEPKAEPKAEAKAKSKAKAKGKAAAAPAAVPQEELPVNVVLDDGSGGSWETNAKPKKEKKEKSAQPQAAGEAKAEQKATYTPAKGQGKSKGGADPARGGIMERAQADIARILALKGEAPAQKEEAEVPKFTASITLPEDKIGMAIGPKGSTIRAIQEKTKVLRIDTAGGVFTIGGDEANVKEAKAAFQDIIDKGFCTLLYEDFSESFVNAHPQYFPDIIGSRGSVIRELKNKLGVEISIPTLPKEYPEAQKFKIKVAGSAKQVKEATDAINDIIQYGHHEITHPGQVHVEMEIDQSCFSFIIGRGGSEMKHIQNSYKVKVAIPRAHSVNEKVLVIGEQESVNKAKEYIEKRILEGETRAKRDPREEAPEATDKWVDKDDTVDAGLQGYIYKR